TLPPPPAPAGLRAVAVGSTHVYLSWFRPSEAVDSYRVNRNGAPISSTSGNTLSYDDTSVSSGRTYHYTVETVRSERHSSPSNDAPVTTPVGSVPVTRSLVVTNAGAGRGAVTTNPSGIDCGSTCSTSFADGALVSLVATPSPGSVFVGWQ